MAAFHTFDIGEGVSLHVRPTEQFKTTTVKVFWRRPLRRETVTQTALIPLVLRRGTGSYPTMQAIAAHLEELYGAGFEVDISKIGETQNLEFYFEIANEQFITGNHNLFEDGLRFLGEAMLDPALDGENFRAEVVKQEAESLRRRIEGLINDKRQYSVLRCLEEMYRDEPFGLYKYGKAEDLDGVDAVELTALYRMIITESPVDIFVVGAVEPDRVRELVTRLWDIPRTRIMSVPASSGGRVGEERTLVEEQDVVQGNLVIGFRSPIHYLDQDYPGLLMANGILGSFPHSKLFVNVREKASLAYFAYARVEGTKGLQYIAAGIDVAKFDEALRIIRRQVEDVKAGSFSDEDLENTRKAFMNGYKSMLDSSGQVADSAFLGRVNGRMRSPEETMDMLEKVTKDDVVKAAAQVRMDTIYFLRNRRNGEDEEAKA